MKVKFKDLLNVLDARAYIKVYDAETKECVWIGRVYHYLVLLNGTDLKGEVVDMQIFMSEIRLLVR